jgi:hypothetical protein
VIWLKEILDLKGRSVRHEGKDRKKQKNLLNDSHAENRPAAESRRVL